MKSIENNKKNVHLRKIIFVALCFTIIFSFYEYTIVRNYNEKEIELLSQQLKIIPQINAENKLNAKVLNAKKSLLSDLENTHHEIKKEKKKMLSENTYLLIILVSITLLTNLKWKNKIE